MKIEEKKIKDIFTINPGSDKFKIPDYQRPYVWNEDKAEEYFYDLINDELNLPFLGSFIFQKKEKIYDIVDGQQRFITTAILIAVLRDIADEEREKSKDFMEKKALENFIFQSENRLVDTGYLRNSINDVLLKVWTVDRNFFENYILFPTNNKLINLHKKDIPNRKDTSKYNIYKNYLKLYELVKEELQKKNIKFTELLTKIMGRLDNMQIVCIYVDTDEEAYTAFEIVNARGQELGNIDLLKNLFYKSASAVDDLEWMKKTWEEITDNIEESSGSKVNTESFLKFFWHSYFGGSNFATSRTIFSKFKQYIQKEGYKKVAIQLLDNSRLFKTFFDLVDFNWTDDFRSNKKILMSLKFLREFNITQAYILFLSIIRNKIDYRKIRKIIEATEKFHFAYSVISKKQANKVEKLYGKFAEDFEKADKKDSNLIGTIYSQFIHKLEDLFPKEEEFMANFREITYPKNKVAIRYVFYKIHEHTTEGATILNFESGDANLEHIIPQSNSNDELDQYLIQSIGNIIPLSKISNSKAGNKNLEEKIKEYKRNSGNKIPILDEIIQRLEKNNFHWSKKDIEEWTDYLGKRIYSITKNLS
jgi:uncharacterized protein with ParB-like and HNH nuclease domain